MYKEGPLLQVHQPLHGQQRFMSMNSQIQQEPQTVSLGKRERGTLSLLHLHGVIVKL
uniref:Uncharacterized protein n=1 Tax=Arundo donax TaxID=35708 RepID=A0A0A9CYW1_ARUDO